MKRSDSKGRTEIVVLQYDRQTLSRTAEDRIYLSRTSTPPSAMVDPRIQLFMKNMRARVAPDLRIRGAQNVSSPQEMWLRFYTVYLVARPNTASSTPVARPQITETGCNQSQVTTVLPITTQTLFS